MKQITPEIKLMTAEHIQKVHHDALTILKETGIKVEDKTARKRFEKAIGRPFKNDRIHLPAELVQWAVDTAPSRIQIYDRLKNTSFLLSGEQHSSTVFGVGVTNLHFQDPSTNDIQPFFRQHMEKAVSLCHTLGEFDFISTPGVIQDAPPETADLFGVIEILANTTKPFVMLISDWEGFNPALDLCNHLTGDIGKHPFIIPYVNPITPLVLNAETTLKMDAAIHHGLPFIFSNYGMSGATCPITPAGTLTLLTAELLAGLVYSQLVKQGTPIILGSLPAAFDMKSAGSFYSPQSLLLNLACADMMKHYNIPHCGTSGCGNGWGADLLASMSLIMNHLTSCLGNVGMVPFVGGSFDSLVFSPELVVFSDDLICQSRQFTLGLDISDEAVGFEDISTIGPGGNFLMSTQTAKHFRKSQFNSRIWPFLSLDKYRDMGSPGAPKFLKNRTCDLMAHPKVPEDKEEIIAKGEDYLKHQVHKDQ